ncbi:MAG: CBS domain-containing protein [Bacteroidetes bacterium]|nr:CBS domain-containing protein [Bacteroidota bacterium]
MKISASIYSGKDRTLEDLVSELDRYRVDYLHIDCNDDLSVFEDIRRIKKISRTPVDLHIISPHPSRFFNGIEETGTEMVSFQYEPVQEKWSPSALNNVRLGLAITTGTPVDIFERFKDECNFLLLMATVPGKSGGVFNAGNFDRIRKFRSRFPGVKIHVDGGINDEISFVLRNMGVSLVVSGSYLVNAEYPGAALHRLRSQISQSPILVRDFMIDRQEAPVLVTGKFSFRDILQTIEDFKLGLTAVIDNNGRLEGIITNADVRRGILNHLGKIENIDPETMVNRNPLMVREDNTITDLLNTVKKAGFPVLYLPVVDKMNRFCGMVTFTHLIEGED